MTSETKVPMPKPLGHVHSDGTWCHERNEAELWPIPVHTRYDVLTYGDARASERDAFWMAKVAEVCNRERDEFMAQAARNDGRQSDMAFGSVNTAERILATLTNPRAGETA